MLRVSVLIVNWNGLDLLSPCLTSLTRQRVKPHEVIVVDNGSTDASRTFLEDYQRQQLLPLKLLFLDENTGFSGGNNAGHELVTGDVIALLNNDTQVDPDWIAAAIEPFEDPSVGMVASKILRMDRPDEIDKVGHLIYRDGLNRGRGTGLPDDGRFSQQEEVLWPDGCAGFYRQAMLDEIGFFDDTFFLYGEDAELGMRSRWAGYRCIFQPQSKVFHQQSAGLGRFSPAKAYYVERNRIWVLIKTFPLDWILISPFFTLVRYLLNIVSLLTKKGSAAGFQESHSAMTLATTLLRALWHGCRGIPKMWQRRKAVLRRINNRQMKAILHRYRISARELTLQD